MCVQEIRLILLIWTSTVNSKPVTYNLFTVPHMSMYGYFDVLTLTRHPVV